ncbi:MAG: hypothetical protein KGM47_16095 [Acidobacteriota bacterium]|nr:hypothetical protein [Acidobacteriota bacterium]
MKRKQRLIRILVLVWLGWYLSGPIAATFDFWDPPREEMHDVERNAGGLVTLIAIVVCFGIVAFRKLRDRFSSLAKALSSPFVVLVFRLLTYIPSTPPAFSHSPPALLRI